jgi:type II secretory pathway component PulJ
MRGARRSGFVLTEVLVGIGLTALLLQALFPMLSTSLLAWKSSVARMTAHQTARMAMESMIRELSLASALTGPLPGKPDSSARFQLRETSGQTESLSFRLGTSSGLNSKTLYRVPGSGQPSPLTQNVVEVLQFRFEPPRRLWISLTVTDPERRAAATVETGVTCRNLPD